MIKEKLRLHSDHLQANPRRVLGPQKSRLVECTFSKHHGYHPANELCVWCDPPTARSADTLSWTYGKLYYIAQEMATPYDSLSPYNRVACDISAAVDIANSWYDASAGRVEWPKWADPNPETRALDWEPDTIMKNIRYVSFGIYPSDTISIAAVSNFTGVFPGWWPK